MTGVGGKLGTFALAMIALGAPLCVPAGLWGGGAGCLALLAAWLLSFVPGCLILAAHHWIRSPQQGVLLALSSTVVRLLFVASGALVIFTQHLLPEMQFAVWVLVCYFAALAVETGLVLRGSPQGDSSPAALAVSLLFNPESR